jgi:hypothetical protein
MKIKFLLILSILVNLSFNAFAIDQANKKRYSYLLLTDDYHILDGKDLADYGRKLSPRLFSLKNSGGYNYWQCFPRGKVSIYLEDMGYSTEDYGWKDTLADLKIRVYVSPRIIHEYQMPAVWPVADYVDRFRLWHKLMAKQKYVCLAGSFGQKEKKLEDDVSREIYYWTFEKIKTNKGSDCYFGPL